MLNLKINNKLILPQNLISFKFIFNRMKVAKSRAFKDRLKGHKQSVIALYSPFGEDGHMLYSVSRDGSMRGWDLAKRQITIKLLLDKTIKTKQQKEQEQNQIQAKEEKGVDKGSNRQQIICAAFTQKYLFGSYEDGTIIHWSFENQGQIIRELVGHQKRVSNLQMIHSKNILVSCSHDATIRTWNINTGETLAVFKTSGAVHLMRVTQDGNIIAIVNRNIFYQINPTNNTILKCIRFQKHSITSFFYKDEILVFGNIENRVVIYNLKEFDPQKADELKPQKIIEGITGWTLCMEFNGEYLYTGCDDKKIRVYSWPDVVQVEELAGHDDGIISLAFADKMLYSGSFDHSIRSWDIKEMIQRILQRNCMLQEDIESKKYEVYYGVVFKNKKKKLPSKKKK